MAKDLKAENLTICVPNKGCNKNCPYCVSRMTGYISGSYEKMVRNLKKVKTVARSAEVTSVLLTGKGEPLLNQEDLKSLITSFSEWPVELQTNGLELLKDNTILYRLHLAGLDTLAVSVDDYKFLDKLQPSIDEANKLGLNVRTTFNIINRSRFHPQGVETFFKECDRRGIQQLTFRRVVEPPASLDNKTSQWIKDNVDTAFYNEVTRNVWELPKTKVRKVRRLNSGMEVWDIDGVSFLQSDYCIQDTDNGNDIRSLIFMEDGHLYTNWGSRASLLF